MQQIKMCENKKKKPSIKTANLRYVLGISNISF